MNMSRRLLARRPLRVPKGVPALVVPGLVLLAPERDGHAHDRQRDAIRLSVVAAPQASRPGGHQHSHDEARDRTRRADRWEDGPRFRPSIIPSVMGSRWRTVWRITPRT